MCRNPERLFVHMSLCPLISRHSLAISSSSSSKGKDKQLGVAGGFQATILRREGADRLTSSTNTGKGEKWEDRWRGAQLM
jgi:hypothetical protein